MKNLKKILLFLGAISLVAFGATNFKKADKNEKAGNNAVTEAEQAEKETADISSGEKNENTENIGAAENTVKKSSGKTAQKKQDKSRQKQKENIQNRQQTAKNEEVKKTAASQPEKKQAVNTTTTETKEKERATSSK